MVKQFSTCLNNSSKAKLIKQNYTSTGRYFSSRMWKMKERYIYLTKIHSNNYEEVITVD